MLLSEEFMDRIYMIYKICLEMKNQFSALRKLDTENMAPVSGLDLSPF